MNWLRKYPIFAAVLGVSVVAVGFEGWWLWRATQHVQRAATALRQRKEERDWLARQSPALSSQNSELIAADVAAAEQRYEELRRALAGQRDWCPAAPASTTDAYFALASFVEKTRALAARQQVEVRSDERFGFASYAQVGPEPDLLAAVHRQRVLVEHLVEALLEARPRALLGVQRERPLSAAQRAAHRTAAATTAAPAEIRESGEPHDFFEPDPQVSLAAAGLIETEAFRLEFTGQTPALRAFLNALAAESWPLAVRSVEVTPRAAPPSAPPAAEARVPLVADTLSKFTVMVEFIELLPVSNPASR